jgi:hypothetical protein
MGDKNMAPLATEMSEQPKSKTGAYGFNREQLKKVIDLYKERKYVEELDYIMSDLKGQAGID